VTPFQVSLSQTEVHWLNFAASLEMMKIQAAAMEMDALMPQNHLELPHPL
jgi:hypothetical protein